MTHVNRWAVWDATLSRFYLTQTPLHWTWKDFWHNLGELIVWATSSSKRKGSGEVVCSSAWWKCADAGVSLLTKISVKGETPLGKMVSGNIFVLGNKAGHPPNLLIGSLRGLKKKKKRASSPWHFPVNCTHLLICKKRQHHLLICEILSCLCTLFLLIQKFDFLH